MRAFLRWLDRHENRVASTLAIVLLAAFNGVLLWMLWRVIWADIQLVLHSPDSVRFWLQ